MRASLYLIGFAAAALVGAGVAEVGCSSSSGGAPATPPEDSGSPGADGTTPEDTGTGGGMDTGKACTASDASAETIMTGSPSWDCQQVQCKTELTACAADCQCN